DVEPAIEAVLDADRVQQILACLLDNTVRYSPDGGAIEVSARATSSQFIQIVVRDHGIGVPPDRRASLFSRYAPGDPHDYRAGLGLGLYVCRRIAELHGGTVTADFPDDGGTRIVVALP